MDGKTRIKTGMLLISAAALACSFFEAHPLPLDPAWVAVVLCGLPIMREAVIGLVTKCDIRADVLVSMALVASVIIGEIFAAGEVAFIMQIGAMLEEMTVSRSRAGIERLVRLTPRTARVVRGEEQHIIPAEHVRVGDVLRILPGETIPVDGVITLGNTSVTEAVMTGEPLPADKGVGDMLMSGTVNAQGSIDMKALKVGQDSSIQRMIRLVQSADAGKARIVRTADRWATWIVFTALAAAALAWWITGDILRAVTVLVVFCPCALVLATPTAITAAIGNAARHHFLVREGDALERLSMVKKIAFDKTGTLTFGVPRVVGVESIDGAHSRELYALAAAAETRSEHPLGKAIVDGYRKTFGQGLSDAENFVAFPGKGVTASVDGRIVAAGTRKFLAELGVREQTADARIAPYQAEGCSIMHLAVDGKAAGFIALADALRPGARQMIADAEKTGVVPVLLTGDQQEAAAAAARRVGIAEMRSRCLPEDKLAYIKGCEAAGLPVAMIGDGINDAPALKAALVGIAMGGIGSDIACDAADIVLVKDDIGELPHLLRLAKRMMRTIKCNLSLSMLLNFAAIGLAMAGILNPVSGALVHNAGSVLVIVNSAFLLTWHGGLKRNGTPDA